METIIQQNIRRIREYTAEHPELQQAHHFLYDKRYCSKEQPVQYVVMGVNPGETSPDWEQWPASRGTPTEESSEFSFHAHGEPSRSAKAWRARVTNILGTDAVVLAEAFFWSSKDRSELEKRYGRLEGSAHLEFCASLNRDLLDFHQPKCVIVSGLRDRDLLSSAYSLKRGEPAINGAKGRLIEPFTDGIRPWIFTKHLSAGFFAAGERDQIKAYLARLG